MKDTTVAVHNANSDNKLRRVKTSEREKFEGLYSLLNALEDVAKDPKDVSKHDEARSVIRNTTLNEYYSRNHTTEWFFAVADQVDEGKCKDVLPKSFRAKVPGWIRMKNLLYDRLRKECIEESGEDAEYKCFSELFPRLLKKTPKQVPDVQNNPTSQGRNTTKAQAATKVGASNKPRHDSGDRTYSNGHSNTEAWR